MSICTSTKPELILWNMIQTNKWLSILLNQDLWLNSDAKLIKASDYIIFLKQQLFMHNLEIALRVTLYFTSSEDLDLLLLFGVLTG